MFIKLTKLSPKGPFPTLDINALSVTAVEETKASVWNETTAGYDETTGTLVHLLGGLSWLVTETPKDILSMIGRAR